MNEPYRHLLPDGTPLYSGYEEPYDENGVDLTLVDAMLARSPAERLAWLEDVVALSEESGTSREDDVLARAGTP